MPDRYYRIIEDPSAYFREYTWHSVSCICERCLDADAAYMAFGGITRIDNRSLFGIPNQIDIGESPCE